MKISRYKLLYSGSHCSCDLVHFWIVEDHRHVVKLGACIITEQILEILTFNILLPDMIYSFDRLLKKKKKTLKPTDCEERVALCS